MIRLLKQAYQDWSLGRRSPGLFCYGALAKPAAWVYQAANSLEQRRRARVLPPLANASLIVVSSPTVGGAGKTPLTAHIVSKLRSQGIDTAIVTRGYGRRAHGTFSLDDEHDATADQIGDEALMLRQQTGAVVVVGKDPAQVIDELDRSGRFGAIVLDDGVSTQWQNEFRIVCLAAADCEHPVRYLPDGRWRVSPHSIRHATAVIVTTDGDISHNVQKIHRERLGTWGYRGPIAWFRRVTDGIVAVDGATVGAKSVPPHGRPLVFCGIAVPQRFFEQVCAWGVIPAGTVSFPDHHRYTGRGIERLFHRAGNIGADYLLTTHKDAVKIAGSRLRGLPLYVLATRLEFIAGDDFFEAWQLPS